MIEVELLYVHIPMRRAAAVVDFDPTQRELTPRKHLEDIEAILSADSDLASPRY